MVVLDKTIGSDARNFFRWGRIAERAKMAWGEVGTKLIVEPLPPPVAGVKCSSTLGGSLRCDGNASDGQGCVPMLLPVPSWGQ